MKDHLALNQTLPFSFTPDKMRSAYLGLKYLKKLQKDEIQLSEKTLEYFLFLFKSAKMWPELIDLCESFNDMRGSDNPSEIRAYYFTEAFLNIPAE